MYQPGKDISYLSIINYVFLEIRKMRNSIKITAFIILLSAFSIKPQTIGQATVKTWANDSKSAFSFSFDDSFKSQYDYALPVLNSFGFKATFYVIAEEPTEQGEPLNWRYGTWDEFREIAAEGHEIGSHTMTHPHLTKLSIGDTATPNTVYYELYQSKKLIEQKIPGITVTTFAYPYTESNSSVQSIAGSYYESSRVGGDIPNNAVITGNKWNKINSYEVQFNTPRNSVSDDNDELVQIENSLQSDDISAGKWGMLFAHEVLPFSQIPDAVAAGYWYPMSTEWLTAFCQWMKAKSDSNEVWVTTVANVTKYIKERESFSSTIVTSTDSRIELNVTDTLDNTIFNYPLTVDILVPSSWQTVSVIQGSSSTTLTTFKSGANNYVRASVMPDGGNVVLTTNIVNSYTLSGTVNYDNTSSTSLKDVSIELKDSNNVVNTTSTDSIGNYSFTNLTSGDYTLIVSKIGGWGGVNAADALLAAKYFTSSATLDSLQLAAGDVDNSGNINAADALLILRRYVNLISSFSIQDWIFSPATTTISITNQNVVKNFKGIAAGNVTRSYIPQ